jgi:hypothetical protein
VRSTAFAGYIRVSSGLGQNPDVVVYKNEVEFRRPADSRIEFLLAEQIRKIEIILILAAEKRFTGTSTGAA